jgi:hypothetical protein
VLIGGIPDATCPVGDGMHKANAAVNLRYIAGTSMLAYDLTETNNAAVKYGKKSK